MLCGSSVVSGLLRRRRSVSWKVPAPVPPRGWPVKALHSSVHQRQRLLELRLPSRFGELEEIWLETGFVNSCQIRLAKAALRAIPAMTASTAASAAIRSTRRRRSGASGRRASARASASATPNTTAPSPSSDEPEHPAVVDAGRVRLPVLRDPRKRVGDAERTGAGGGGERGGDEALDPVAVEHDPARGRGDRERDPEAGVRQQQRDDGRIEQERAGGPDDGAPAARRREPERHRHRDVCEQRELVPVAERRAERARRARSPP